MLFNDGNFIKSWIKSSAFKPANISVWSVMGIRFTPGSIDSALASPPIARVVYNTTGVSVQRYGMRQASMALCRNIAPVTEDQNYQAQNWGMSIIVCGLRGDKNQTGKRVCCWSDSGLFVPGHQSAAGGHWAFSSLQTRRFHVNVGVNQDVCHSFIAH